MSILPDENKLLNNFSRCLNWEQKYLYLIELGEKLLPLTDMQKQKKNQVLGCQSLVWIVMEPNNEEKMIFFGDSDSSIVKGLIALVIIIFQNKTVQQILTTDSKIFFQKLSLEQHLTPSRNHGLHSIIKTIYQRAEIYKINKLNNE
ncbi:Cysteine desulfuration protein SufE [Candidatus Arsenophonus lipoptenae]|uniref:Cysteine desulfuration protein SufE n=1 Tax=Candidatus Arsenophonus lipoptenae TaxID=634113 RepID=A0A109Q8L6_9GAMM|nr:cysteine desulfuration protein SufE [Candidatus Arsenophonus lipoptenae]AMA64680.1 Cysteine desulfuration protein SufE [Candidatus Arsenophonus lipoptenae]